MSTAALELTPLQQIDAQRAALVAGTDIIGPDPNGDRERLDMLRSDLVWLTGGAAEGVSASVLTREVEMRLKRAPDSLVNPAVRAERTRLERTRDGLAWLADAPARQAQAEAAAALLTPAIDELAAEAAVVGETLRNAVSTFLATLEAVAPVREAHARLCAEARKVGAPVPSLYTMLGVSEGRLQRLHVAATMARNIERGGAMGGIMATGATLRTEGATW